MKSNELRLGNLIKIGGNTLDTYQTFKPSKVNLAILNEIERENEERPDAILSVFQPIPLTEEWLLKFGFEWSIFHQAFHKDNFVFDLNEFDVGIYSMTTFKRGHVLNQRIEYVHQLQNLYFALTGEELKTE